MDVSLTIPDAAIGSDWHDLARRSLAPGGPHSPELLLPALNGQTGARLACVRDSDGLQLILPLAKGSLISVYCSHSTPLSIPSLPLVGAATAAPALAALLRVLRSPVLLRGVPMAGPLWEPLANAADHMTVLDEWERAILRPGGGFAEWFATNFERKRRKEYRRLQARLSERGRFEALTLDENGDITTWTDEFLTLEAAGWKGKRGTALKIASGSTLHESLLRLAASGKLRFWKLALDGKPIAMLYAIVDRGQAWLGKIAYDENNARFSPGVLLILHATHRLFEENVKEADSCAIPGHPMIDNIWRDRLKVADVMIAGPTVNRTGFALLAKSIRLRMKFRGQARDLYYSLRGRHRS